MCEVTGRQIVLSPFGSVREVPLAPGAGARFDGALAASRVAIVDNEIVGMAELAEQIERVLRTQYRVQAVVQWTVPHSRPVDAALRGKLLDASDLVILGLGNCGACTTWNCEVTADFARRAPVLGVVTERFREVARAALRARGHPAPALVMVADTPDLLEPDTLAEQAAVVASAVGEQLIRAARA